MKKYILLIALLSLGLLLLPGCGGDKNEKELAELRKENERLAQEVASLKVSVSESQMAPQPIEVTEKETLPSGVVLAKFGDVLKIPNFEVTLSDLATCKADNGENVVSFIYTAKHVGTQPESFNPLMFSLRTPNGQEYNRNSFLSGGCVRDLNAPLDVMPGDVARGAINILTENGDTLDGAYILFDFYSGTYYKLVIS